MGIRKLITFVAFALVAAGLVAVPAPAHAADKLWTYAINTGGTYVKVFDGTVQSDFTAQSSVSGGANSATATNSTAAVDVSKLLRVGAIETSSSGDVSADATKLSSFARTAQVSLLGGLIKADAVETTVTTTAKADGTVTHTADSQLLGIKIAGVKLPVDIPENFAVNIPGIASVSLNYSLHGRSEDKVATLGWAIGVTLLTPRDGYPAGVTLMVNPVQQYLVQIEPSPGAALYGGSYATRIDANVGDAIKVVSSPTAFTATPFNSSNGKTLSNSTLAVKVPGIIDTGVVATTTTSTKDTLGNAEITNTSRVAGLSLLGGLIKADAIEVTATAKRHNGVWTHSEEMKTVHLTVAGQLIPIDVSPNTAINIAGLGKVELNKRVVSVPAQVNSIYGLQITLDTAKAGLPVGATIKVAVSGTGMNN